MSRILCTSTGSRLLHLLAVHGPLDVVSIGQALDISPARVRHLLQALRHRGFVNRLALPSGAGAPPLASPWQYAADRHKVDTGLCQLLVDFGAGHD